MNRTSCERRHFPIPMRWLHAGNDLSRSDHSNQCADCPLMRSKRTPKCPLQVPDLACMQTCRSHPANVAFTIEVGASIKSP